MSKSAFTLIELMIVIVIISILMVVLISGIYGWFEEGRDIATKSFIDGLNQAVGLYKNDYNFYPKSDTGEPWRSCYLAFALGVKGAKSDPYFPFKEGMLTVYPISDENSSDIKSPSGGLVKYRNNLMDVFVNGEITSVHPPLKNTTGVDIWARGGRKDENETAYNNWK
ncbi:MAG: prepilin-type N-terminal cleavage/methylation domain-containing protein [Planctomycetes bacterium]|nr:prepilin-type N-terminal cleavage/methylation domain-containing protein [Planctomycetota bacterium]